MALPDGSDGKESACNAGDQGSIPGLERSPGKIIIDIYVPIAFFLIVWG